MHVSIKRLLDCKLLAQDGEIGSLDDVLFEDDEWKTAYLVVRTGVWLFGRDVLISPRAASEPDLGEKLLPVSLTQEQIKNAPDLAVALPLDRRDEAEYHDYYRWPYYWGGSSLAGIGYGVPVAAEAMLVGDTDVVPEEPESVIPPEERSDPDLRSAKSVFGYEVRVSGSRAGEVEDFIIDFKDAGCDIPYAVVRLEDDKRVVLPTGLISHIGPPEDFIEVDISADLLIGAPAFDEHRLEGGGVDELGRYFTRSR